jgi:hypothetical protein
MNRTQKYILLSLALLNFTIAGVSDAAAYLDPGTGSIIFQSLIAVVATGLAVFATAWKNVTVFFQRPVQQQHQETFRQGLIDAIAPRPSI